MFLTSDDCVAYNLKLTQATGSIHGVRDPSMLDSAIARFSNKLAYDPEADIFSAAATVMEGIVLNHPFVDGNKRTAMQVLKRILVDNHILLTADSSTQFDVVLAVAEKTMNANDVGEWLRSETCTDPVYAMLSDYDMGKRGRDGHLVSQSVENEDVKKGAVARTSFEPL